MRVVITGANGQLGRELQHTAPADVELLPLTRADLDIANPAELASVLSSLAPQLVINAAAYTAVDKAEQEPELAQAINADGPGYLAQYCAAQGARLIHVSTDFVFDGSQSRPYSCDDQPRPLGVYGQSKYRGEQQLMAQLPAAVIVRTAWVYSTFGGNFVATMLRLMGERDSLQVVADQMGSPTWTRGLTQILWRLVERPELSGIYHWTDAGVCSWYDFALAIYEEASALGLLQHQVEIKPCTTAQYPTPAKRPAYSVLAKEQTLADLDMSAVPWRDQLRSMLLELSQQAS